MNAGEEESDEEIAARAQAGDRHAFELLVRRHKSSIYRFIRRYVGDADDAYDVLQDCFVSAWSGLPRYDPMRPFLPWLRTVALNKCRDFARRRAVRRLVLSAFASESAEPRSVEAPDGFCDEEDVRLARLDKAIASLPAFYKEPLLLTSVSGLSHEEAAQMLRTTAKAIEMRVYRARRRVLKAVKSRPTEG